MTVSEWFFGPGYCTVWALCTVSSTLTRQTRGGALHSKINTLN